MASIPRQPLSARRWLPGDRHGVEAFAQRLEGPAPPGSRTMLMVGVDGGAQPHVGALGPLLGGDGGGVAGVDRARDRRVEDGGEPQQGFDRLWDDPRSTPLTAGWLRRYRRPAEPGRPPVPPAEPPPAPPTPRPVQVEAVQALEQTRQAGHGAAMVVMATGLGKTWLVAFDATRPQFRRVLFVAHRDEILRQARDVFHAVDPAAELGLCTGDAKQPEAKVVFASVRTLAGRLHQLPPGFDYVVVDELHHAATRGYRAVIDHFRPGFLLGLTATPDRMDGADLLALCGDNLVYECNLVEGIRRGELSPFHGFASPARSTSGPSLAGPPLRPGCADRSGGDPAAGPASVGRVSPAGPPAGAGLLRVGHPRPVHGRLLHGQGSNGRRRPQRPDSAGRRRAVEELRQGTVDVIFTVDVFNEDLDIPEIEAVLLCPTGSPVVFLQQLGRGLRRSAGKDALVVIDLIGSHRSSLGKPRALLAVTASRVPSAAQVEEAMRSGELRLPPGCSVDFDPQAVDLLARLPGVTTARSALEQYCRTALEQDGVRPPAMQTLRAGFNPATVRSAHRGWFGFLDHLVLLGPEEAEVLRRHGDVLLGVETDSATKSYKLVTLIALLQDGMLCTGAGSAGSPPRRSGS